MVGLVGGRGGRAAGHLADLDTGPIERPQLDRIERRRRVHQFTLTVPDDETTIEPDVELDLLPSPTAPVGLGRQLQGRGSRTNGAVPSHGAAVLESAHPLGAGFFSSQGLSRHVGPSIYGS